MDRAKRSLWLRILYAIPVLGWITRDVFEGDASNIYYALAIGISLWLIAIIQFGYPAVIIPALILVVVTFVTLIIMTRG